MDGGIADAAVFVDAAGEEVLHQASLDALVFGNQRLRLLNRSVHMTNNRSDRASCASGDGSNTGVLSTVALANPYRVLPVACCAEEASSRVMAELFREECRINLVQVRPNEGEVVSAD